MNNRGVTPPPASGPQASGNRVPTESPQAARALGVFRNLRSAEAAAWSPDPKNPPKFFDLPVEDGTVHPDIVAKWIANSPLAFVDQYASNLKKYRAIRMDVGDKDNLAATNKLMDESLTPLGVVHSFEVYEDTHGNRVKERFETKVLPFFSENLDSPAGQGSR
ncbi:MAG: hypothetical protein WBE37_33760 [Bryobacteraceae bacterium]